MMRIFSLHNPKLPVTVVCERCGEPVRVPRKHSPAGEQWISGEDLIKCWFDHQLIECVPSDEKEVNNAGPLGG